MATTEMACKMGLSGRESLYRNTVAISQEKQVSKSIYLNKRGLRKRVSERRLNCVSLLQMVVTHKDWDVKVGPDA